MAAKKNKKKIWFGFLEAGARSSPVVRDESLDTGRSTTIYLFNFMKGRIIEYQRDIVEAKLRDLTIEESAMLSELESEYLKAKETFIPRAQGGPKKLVMPRHREKNDWDVEIPSFDEDEMQMIPTPDSEVPDLEMADDAF